MEETKEQTTQKKKIEFNLSDFSANDRDQMTQMYEETLKDFEPGSIVTGKVMEVHNNEVLVDIGYKSEGLIPANEFEELDQIEPGDELYVLLSEIEDDDGMVVLSKQKADDQMRWDRIREQYDEGNVIKGTVKRRVKGGLIVNVEGVDAFLPGSHIDVTPVRDMDSCLGQTYDFKIIKMNPERKNIIVSRRQLIEDSRKQKRQELLETIEPGQTRQGIVKNITDFGVFVDLDGMDGLLHITDMSWGRIKHPSEMVSIGDPLEVRILDIDYERERVSLGLKQKEANPWQDVSSKYPVGSRLRGKVVNIVPYGAFVELEEGVEGLVHVSEISWTKRIVRASDVLSLGDEVDVAVLDINEQEQKIALGMRQTEENPWDTVQERYPVGSRVKGTVRNFTSYGAFLELEDGIDGMIHVSDMSWTRKVNHPSEVLEKGQEVEAAVLEVDSDNKRISLGLKQAHDDPWASIADKYKVGDLVKGVVSKIASFGAFVEIEEGVDGLVHISQISEGHVDKVQDALQVGQEVEARIVRIDRDERRIGLSIKAATLPDEEFQMKQEELMEGLKPGEDMVDLAGAFDEAFDGLVVQEEEEEWRPGQHEDESGQGDEDFSK
jgi:small subunit ribosomal protein S1